MFLIFALLASLCPLTTLANGPSRGAQPLLPHDKSLAASQSMQILLADATNQGFLQAAGTFGGMRAGGWRKPRWRANRRGGKRAAIKDGKVAGSIVDGVRGMLKRGGKGKGKQMGGGNGGRGGKEKGKGAWGVALRNLPIWNAAKFQLKARRALGGLNKAMAAANTARGHALNLLGKWTGEVGSAGAEPRDVWSQTARDCVHQLSLAQLSMGSAAEILQGGSADASDAVFKLSAAATLAENCKGAFEFLGRSKEGEEARYAETADVRDTATGLRDSVQVLQQQAIDMQVMAATAAGGAAAASVDAAADAAAAGAAGATGSGSDQPTQGDVASPASPSSQSDVAIPASPSSQGDVAAPSASSSDGTSSSNANGDGTAASDGRKLVESWPSMMGGDGGWMGRGRRMQEEGGGGEGGAGEGGGEEGGEGTAGEEGEGGAGEGVTAAEGAVTGGEAGLEGGEITVLPSPLEGAAGGEEERGGEGVTGGEGAVTGVAARVEGGEITVLPSPLEGTAGGDKGNIVAGDPYSDPDPEFDPADVEGPAHVGGADDVDYPGASIDPAATEGQQGSPYLSPDCPKPEISPPPVLPPFSPPRLMPNLVVAQDGSGDFVTIQDAILAAPKKPKGRFVILVMPGVYNEQFEIRQPNITLIGLSPAVTVITGNASVGTNYTTFKSATVAIEGDYFAAANIRFENTAGKINNQAVALRVSADQCVFHNCEFWGFQDTLYTHSGRQYYRDCFVTGNVDFIFGNAAAVFDNCTIQIRQHTSSAPVSASSRQTPIDPTGIVILNSRVVGETTQCVTGFLGRPWKSYARVAVLNSFLSPQVSSLGWMDWNGQVNETTSFIEFNNTGPGASGPRVPWLRPGVLSNATAVNFFLPDKFLYPFGVMRALLPWL